MIKGHVISAQSGSSLIEVLVAIVVVAVGLLGVSGMFVLSTRGAADAASRTVATQAAYELADRIRANRIAIASYLAPAWGVATPIPNGAALPTNCFAVACTPAQQADFDLRVWARSLTDASLAGLPLARSARLPQARAVVCRSLTPEAGTPAAPACTGGATDPIVIKIWWSERSATAAENATAGALIQRRYALTFLP